jgi:hypothetical protein
LSCHSFNTLKPLNGAAVQTRMVGDRVTPLYAKLQQQGVDFDLSDYSLRFSMVSEEGTVKVPLVNGVVVLDAAEGLVAFFFSASHVDTPGVYYAFFEATHNVLGHTETFPSGGRDFAIRLTPRLPGS